MPENRYQRNTVVNYRNVPNYEAHAWRQVEQADLRTAKVADDFTALALKSADVIIEQDKQIEGMLAGQGPNPKLKTGAEMLLSGSQKYNEALVASYGLELVTDAKVKVAELKGQSKNSTEFRKLFGHYSKGVLDGVGDPRLKALAQSKLSQYGEPIYTEMFQAETNRKIKVRQVNLLTSIDVAMGDALDAARAGGESSVAAIKQYREWVKALMGSSDPMNRLDPEAAQELLSTFNTRLMVQVLEGGLEKVLARGPEEAYEYTEDFRKANPSDFNLTVEAHEEAYSRLIKDVDAYYESRKAQEQFKEDILDGEQEGNTIKIMKEFTNPENPTSPSQKATRLGTAVQNKEITITQARNIEWLSDRKLTTSSAGEVYRITNQMYSGKPQEVVRREILAAHTKGLLLTEDALKLFNQNASGELVAVTQNAEWGLAASMIKRRYAKSDSFGYVVEADAIIVNDNLTKLRERVLAGESPVEAANAIMKAVGGTTDTLEKTYDLPDAYRDMTLEAINADIADINEGDNIAITSRQKVAKAYFEEREAGAAVAK